MSSSYSVFLQRQTPNSEKELVWSESYSDIDLVAGMMAASLSILSKINNDSENEAYYMDSDAKLGSYIIFRNVQLERIPDHKTRANHKYFVWVPSEMPFHYNLFGFNTASFIQGIISICKSFELDFLDYIYEYPFDNKGNLLVLEGYRMLPYTKAIDVPELDDVEEEEKDNENLIELLHKDY